jgi:hypothetical protein
VAASYLRTGMGAAAGASSSTAGTRATSARVLLCEGRQGKTKKQSYQAD